MINILEEHDLDYFVTSMIEEPTINVGITNYKKNEEGKDDHICVCEGQLHVSVHTIEDNKGVF